jgi:hypothetical protein
MATLSIIVTLFSQAYEVFGWDHPRAFQPQECASPYTTLNYSKLAFSCESNGSTGQATQSTAGNVTQLNDCVMKVSNNTCGSCRLGITQYPSIGSCWLYCVGLTRETYSLTFDCVNTAFVTPIGENSTYYLYCTQNAKLNYTYADILAVANQKAKCKNAGFDLLNASVLWGATILIMCIEALFKLAMILGIFNKE